MLMTDCILFHSYKAQRQSMKLYTKMSYDIWFGLMSHRQINCADKTISGLSTQRLDYNYGMKLPDKTISIDQI